MEKTIGDKIRELRINTLKLKQIELAEILEVERAYISQIESNRRKPGRDLLIKLCTEFNLSLDWITSSEENKTSSHSTLSNDEQSLLYAFRNIPEEEAKMYLQLMLQRASKK